jgi:ABC-type sugar transport system substrate-binding protein
LKVGRLQERMQRCLSSQSDLVTQPADGIIFTPYWATAARGLSLAKDANIPVILTDSYPDGAVTGTRSREAGNFRI